MRTTVRFAVIAVALAVTALCGGAATASAQEFGIQRFDGSFLDSNGSASTQAGGHPHSFTTEIEFSRTFDPDFFQDIVNGSVRNVTVDTPAGFVGNPTVTPTRCVEEQLADVSATEATACPPSSQVGVATVNNSGALLRRPVYNMVPPSGAPAMFGFMVLGSPVHLIPRLRSDGDYGISVDVRNVSQGLHVLGSSVTLWGVPADPSHDADRGWRDLNGNVTACADSDDPACTVSTDAPRRAFLTNPTRCTAPGVGLETRLTTNSWQDPTPVHASFFSHLPPPDEATQQGPEGCDRVPFAPTLSTATSTSEPDAPVGLAVELGFPQVGTTNPDGIATAHLEDAKITLPEGMTINPASAGGLTACADSQLRLASRQPVTCPESSKIGTVTATTPVLTEQLTGGVYVRSQASADPESGDMFRIALVMENAERGISVRLPGRVRASRSSGRLEVTFDDNPQLPVSTVRVQLKDGPRAPLAMPARCGSHSIQATLTSWAGHTVTLGDSFTTDCPGTTGFAPSFEAGALSPVGGSFSPFAARIERSDREGYLSKVDVDMPKGLLAKLAGVELCPDAVAGDGTPGACPADSRIGTATVGAGAGTPFRLSGPVYLTGPYKGAPYGLSVQVPAKAGPYDLGMVKVRNALHVDPETAQASVVSDALPQVVKGVPVRLRSVDVEVDRPGFAVNPTSCAEKRVEATLTSIGGAVHRTGNRFQVGDCRALGFTPRLGMRLVGKRQMRSGGHPVLRARVTQGGGQANIRRAKVTLPPNVVLDSENSVDPKLLCGYDASLRADCPASSIIGRASLRTPLLNRPLSGPVHFVQGIRFGKTGNRIRTLPTLLVKLRGEVAINLRSQTNTDNKDRLVSVFPSIPDARAGRFDIQIDGGRKGILVVTENRRGRISLCSRKQTALIETDAHNGKRADYPIRVKTACSKRRKR